MPDDLTGRLDGMGFPEDEEPPAWSEPQADAVNPNAPEGVTPLGHDRGTFYYLSNATRQVFALTHSQHTKTALMAMASVAHHWQRSRFVNDKKAVQWDNAIDWLMGSCRQVGIYNPDRIRGLGAWMDEGRSVLHIGDELIVDGEHLPLMLDGSYHIYEAATRLVGAGAEPLSNARARALREICESLRWEAKVNGTLLAGFLAVAPICGGLAWRPSIWITGGAGSGKSTLMERILAPALGGFALQVQSETTEPGLRQALGCDARPVLFDEAEGETHAAATRIQSILGLVRQSASEGGADIIKGNSDGKAKRFRIRSCFVFSSINHGVSKRADAGRVSVLSLREPDGRDPGEAEAFEALKRRIAETLTSDFATGLMARSARLLPIIRANAETFAVAVAVHVGSRRDGDQIGTLLAGAYSLSSNALIAPDAAAEIVRRYDWNAVASQQAEKDEDKLLSRITQHRMRFSQGQGGAIEATIGRMLAASFNGDAQILPETAEMELRAIGIRPDWQGATQGVFISNTHPALARILSDTPWAAGWERALRRLKHAEKTPIPIRFQTGHKARATWLPMTTVDPAE